MGELFDDYSDSAREIAGRFRYDADKKGQNERNVMNFSVEGSKIAKEGITVTRSIARKITITILPCNKAAVAEMVSIDKPNPKKSAVDELFKTEGIEIEVFTPDMKASYLLKREGLKKDMGGGQSAGLASTALSGVGATSAGGLMASEKLKKTDAPKLKLAGVGPENKPKAHERGARIGVTNGGHGVFSHGMIGDYSHFSHRDHTDASASHQSVSDASKDPKIKMHHSNKARLHAARATSVELKSRNLKKALDAGSALAGPANLSGGAVLGKEDLEKDVAATMQKDAANPKLAPKDVKVKQLQSQVDTGKYKPNSSKIADKMIIHPEKPLKKSIWLQRAESEYKSWNKREQFEAFMKSRMPHLSKGEIQIIGQTMILQKSIKQEKMLKDFYNPSMLRSEKNQKK